MTTASVPSPLSVICPACNAQPGEPCTQPTERPHNSVKFFHFTRVSSALDEQRRAREEAADAAILNDEPVEVRSEEPPEHPSMKAAAEEWDTISKLANVGDHGGVYQFEVHKPCGTMQVTGHRDLHLTVCPSVETRFSPEQLAELQRTRYPITREEQEERATALAVARSKSPMQRHQEAVTAREAEYRALGMKPFTVYAEGYAATGEHGVATAMGTHWGYSFNDAIERWKLAGGKDAQYLSRSRDRFGRAYWTHWGCRLFDNLHDAQKSYG